jgi:hypothetical protein
MNEKISAFFKVIVKYGGANLVIFLVSAWFFDSFFHVDGTEVQQKLGWLLTAIFIETIFVMTISRIIWTMEKFRDFKEGKTIKDEMNGKAVSTIAKEVGVGLIVDLAEKMAKTPEEKEKKAFLKEIKELEKGLDKY